MVLESTIICLDSSEFMRNGDFIPSRLQSQQEAATLVVHTKLRSNPENNVGLLSIGGKPQVLTTLTTDVGKLLTKMHGVQTEGEISFLNGIRIAHLALKHRQGKNHKMRIVIFVGSPVETDEKELVKLAKKLKKEKVSVDVVNFGEEVLNTEKLSTFITTLDSTSSHMVTVPSGSMLSEALISSPIIVGEDGAGPPGMPGNVSGFEFGFDPNEDPELAMALRVSMEEQRMLQAQAEIQASGSAEQASGSQAPAPASSVNVATTGEGIADQQIDLAAMTDEEQMAYALQMSLANDVDTPKPATSQSENKDSEERMDTN